MALCHFNNEWSVETPHILISGALMLRECFIEFKPPGAATLTWMLAQSLNQRCTLGFKCLGVRSRPSPRY